MMSKLLMAVGFQNPSPRLDCLNLTMDSIPGVGRCFLFCSPAMEVHVRDVFNEFLLFEIIKDIYFLSEFGTTGG